MISVIYENIVHFDALRAGRELMKNIYRYGIWYNFLCLFLLSFVHNWHLILWNLFLILFLHSCLFSARQLRKLGVLIQLPIIYASYSQISVTNNSINHFNIREEQPSPANIFFPPSFYFSYCLALRASKDERKVVQF